MHRKCFNTLMLQVKRLGIRSGADMTRNLNSGQDGASRCEYPVLEEFKNLWQDAHELWEKHRLAPAFEGYVSGDYAALYHALADLQGQAWTFLEWGSGLGVLTIMASRMGFEAYGIETELTLIDHATDLAQQYGSEATFAQGSFIPEGFDISFSEEYEIKRTVIDMPSGYDAIDMELRDFDVVYGFPWPEEHIFFRTIMKHCGNPETLFLSYDARDEISLCRVSDL